MLYSVVIPCYKSAHTIREVVETTAEELTKLGRTPFEFVLTDDCSPDGGETVRELRKLADDYDYVKIIELAKNGGQHNASLAGMNYAEGDFIISMDDDMQTHPSQLSKLFDKLGGIISIGGYQRDRQTVRSCLVTAGAQGLAALVVG